MCILATCLFCALFALKSVSTTGPVLGMFISRDLCRSVSPNTLMELNHCLQSLLKALKFGDSAACFCFTDAASQVQKTGKVELGTQKRTPTKTKECNTQTQKNANVLSRSSPCRSFPFRVTQACLPTRYAILSYLLAPPVGWAPACPTA